MNAEDVKYTRIEYERRFIVPTQANWRANIEPYSKIFKDKYLRNTRLRLRVLTDTDTGRRVIKLNKKAESPSPYFRTISRILLSPDEYQLFDRFEGDRLKKERHYYHHLGRVFSIDVFEGELEGLILCETEAEGMEDLMSAQFPAFATREVTEDAFFTGGNLCRAARADLLRKLAAFQ